MLEEELDELDELDAVFSATFATLVMWPVTTLVDGSVTCTASPTRASVCLDVSRATVTTGTREVVTSARFDTEAVLEVPLEPDADETPDAPAEPADAADADPVLGADPLPAALVGVEAAGCFAPDLLPEEGVSVGVVDVGVLDGVVAGVVVVGVVTAGVVVVGVVVAGVVVAGVSAATAT